jgi:hypothetical protein
VTEKELNRAARGSFPAWVPLILRKNGKKHQLSVAIEELAELTKELTKAQRGKESDMRVSEEIADVEICLRELKYLYDPTGSKVSLFEKHKIDRLIKFYIEGGHK